MKTVYITRNELFKGLDMVLCNNINNIDESFIDDNMELFQHDCDTCKNLDEEKQKNCEDCFGEGYHASEVYQYFISSISEYRKEQFDSFNVPHGYSEALDVDIIPIYDFGTGWNAFSYSKEVADDYELEYNETLTRQTVY